MEDFDSTLYFLDENEVQYLQGAIKDHYATDLRQNVVNMLLDVFEQQSDPAIRDEVCLILDGMLVNLLTAGQLRAVAVAAARGQHRRRPRARHHAVATRDAPVAPQPDERTLGGCPAPAVAR